MRRLLSFLLVTCICFGLVGCNKANNTTSSNLSSTETNTNIKESNKVKIIKNGKEEVLTYKESDDNRLEGIGEIVDMVTSPLNHSLNSIVITTEGKLYEYTYGEKMFSNGKYYKEIINDVKFSRFIYGNLNVFLIDENFNLYHVSFDEKITITNVLDSDWFVDDKIKTYIGKEEILNVFFDEHNNFFTINDNKVFCENELIFSIPSEETIEQITNNLIKTNKKYYHIDLKQIESKYADVEDTYKFVLDTVELEKGYSLSSYYIISDNDIRYMILKEEKIIDNFYW